MENKKIFFIIMWAGLVISLFLLFGCTGQQFSTYSLEEVETHSIQNDCWIATNGNVYDITQLVLSEPANPMLNSCGKNITNGFGQRGALPSDANQMDAGQAGSTSDFNRPKPDFNGQKRDFNGPTSDVTQQRGGEDRFAQYLIGKLG